MKLRPIFTSVVTIALLALCAFATRAQVTVIKAGKLVAPEMGTTAINQIHVTF